MRHPGKYHRIRLKGQVAAVALLVVPAAGCSADVTRFGTLFEPTGNQQTIVAAAPPDRTVTGSLPPPVAPAPVGGVTAAPLPAPGAPSYGSPSYGAPVAGPVAALPAPVQPSGAPVRPVAGWSAEGGSPYVIREGDTIAVISRRYGVPEKALRSANNLSQGAGVQPGQQIVIPVYNNAGAPAAVAAAPSAAPLAQPGTAGRPAASAAGVHVVQSGDRLGDLALRYGFRSSRELAAYAGIDPNAPIRVGQKIKVPAGGAAPTQVASLGTLPTEAPRPPAQASVPVAAAPALPAPGPAPVAAAPAAVPAAPQTVASAPATQMPPVASDAGLAAAPAGNFRWPVSGRVISSFGPRAEGGRNDGINIEAPKGTPIKAADGGEVIYAGNELKGYGNLVLVKHAGGLVTAYAHADEIRVQRGDRITRGQTIATVGDTGSVERPQLHFEIRQGNKPVDPLPFLRG